MTREAPRSGSMERTKWPGIYRRGSKWVAVVSYKRGGKSRQKWITAVTLEAVRADRRAFLNSLDKGIRPDGAKLTFGELVEKVWLPELERLSATEGKPRPSTIATYRKMMNNHVLPVLRDVLVKDIDRDVLRDLYRDLPTPATAQFAHSVISAAFSWAVKDRGILAVNPCASIRRPKAERPEARHLDVADAQRMLGAAKGDRIEAAIILGLVGGLRIGEVCGVRWGDIDLLTGRLLVKRSFWGKTKSGKARGITLPAAYVQELRRYKARQAQELLPLGIAQDDETHIVARLDGRPMNPDTLETHFSRFCKANGFDINFHALRHTAAILMLRSGIDVRTVAGRLGHSNAALVLSTYSHFVQSGDDAAAEALGAILS